MPSWIAFVNFSSIVLNLALASDSISKYLLIFCAISLLDDLKIIEQDVNPIEIGKLKGIIAGKATELPNIPSSEIIRKNSIPRQIFNNLVYFFLIVILALISLSKKS